MTTSVQAFGDYQLVQLVGEQRDPSGRVRKIPQAIDQVMRCGERIGYIGRHSGAPFTPIRQLSPEELADAIKAITALRFEQGLFGPPGRASTYPHQATPEVVAAALAQRAEKEDEEEDDGDDDFDAELDAAYWDE